MKLSIVIPVKYGIEMTQVCLDSIKLYTTDYEIIIVADGADDNVKQFLRKIKCNHLIENNKSLGFPAAVNQGISVTKGEYVVILNNDVAVFPDWSKRMIAHFERDKKLGELSCTTNRVEGFQHIEYNKKGVDFQYTDVVTGFLMMFRKKTLEEIKKKDGFYFDERFGLGGQEDSSMAFEIRKLGYEIGIARDVFVWHYGSYSFREEFNHDATYSREYARSRVDILRKKYNNYEGMNNQIIKSSIQAQVDNNKILIMICVCTLGTLRAELVNNLIFWSHSSKYKIIIKNLVGVLPLDNARSQCVKEFMEISNNQNDRLWFIDDDIVPPSNAIDKLVEADKDVIGALCFMMKPDDRGLMVPVPVALKYNDEKKYIVYFDGKGITEVDAIGGGCVMVKRHVFEKISEKGNRLYQFHYYPDGTLKLVGDFHFCQQVQDAGMKVYVDYGTICEHIKSVGLRSINDMMCNLR